MITPIILAGGTGSRLWPVSRKAYPKQFTSLTEGHSLFQETLLRFSGAGYAAPTVLTAADYRFIAAEQADAVSVLPAHMVLEPSARGTAPAVLAAALLHQGTPEAVLLVSSSDHRVADPDQFATAIQRAEKQARKGHIVVFGAEPERPETGYGYLELAATAAGHAGARRLSRFVEKPDAARAQAMLDDGNHLWNCGMFMFRVDTILKAYNAHAPELFAPCQGALRKAVPDLDFLRLASTPWDGIEAVSIDVAVMEQSPDLLVVPLDCGWTDMGSWDSVWRDGAQDLSGNVVQGDSKAVDCTDTLLHSTADGPKVVGLGLTGVTAIATGDAVLVTRTDASQDVKKVLAALEVEACKQATEFERCHRPWGHYETLALGPRFQVKRIVVKPGGQLSLQSHHHRSEHWTVVEGTASVTVGEEVALLTENESTYIPLGAVHRLENPGKQPLTLIEVQSGCYLGEDDIVRYEDIYARNHSLVA